MIFQPLSFHFRIENTNLWNLFVFFGTLLGSLLFYYELFITKVQEY